MRAKKILHLGLGSILAIAIIGYALFEARFLITGPTLEIYSPKHGETINSSITEVSGKATQATFITLNGNQIFTDEDGLFKETVPLVTGYNIIVVSSQNKFERTLERRVDVIRK